ncbi:hypothetical protein [Zobellella maritima]|uniref:hypothetical protein n=1 Tax=Zobellella maritima TaxID=2059725 RepID=UPI000E30A5CE|nr:hypothetical protein [Zobellella maritima]
MRILYFIADGDYVSHYYARMLAGALHSLGGELEVVCPAGAGVAALGGLTFSSQAMHARLRQQDYQLVFAGNSGLALWLKLFASSPVFMLAQGHTGGLIRRAGIEVIGLDWFHFGRSVLPPLLDTLSEARSSDYDVCLALPHQPLEKIIRYQAGGAPKVCCHPEVTGMHRIGALTLLPWQHWPAALRQSRTVLSEGQLSVVAEALHCGIGLTLLNQGQGRVSCHSRLLVELELASRLARLSEPFVPPAIKPGAQLPRVHYPRVANALMHWLLAGQPVSLATLARQLWRQVLFAEWADEHLHELVADDDMQCGGLLR